MWIWTARLPENTETFTVKNCGKLQVHVDCTRGTRQYIIKKFNIINVTTLEILKPSSYGQYLHDNAPFPQLPYNLNIQNVGNIIWHPESFDKPGDACKYQFVQLTNVTLDSLVLKKFYTDLFKGKNLNQVILKNLTVRTVNADDPISLMTSDIVISNSIFPELSPNSIQLKSRNVNIYIYIDTYKNDI